MMRTILQFVSHGPNLYFNHHYYLLLTTLHYYLVFVSWPSFLELLQDGWVCRSEPLEQQQQAFRGQMPFLSPSKKYAVNALTTNTEWARQQIILNIVSKLNRPRWRESFSGNHLSGCDRPGQSSWSGRFALLMSKQTHDNQHYPWRQP